MSPDPNNINAAPNLCQAKIKVLSVTPSSQFADKVELEFDLLEARCLDGPDFISRHVGEQLEGFTFKPPDTLKAGTEMLAEVSYLGGPDAGVYHLSELKITP